MPLQGINFIESVEELPEHGPFYLAIYESRIIKMIWCGQEDKDELEDLLIKWNVKYKLVCVSTLLPRKK